MLQIESILAHECALTKERPLIAGVSGGADSLCLLGVLREAGYPVVVGHFDHQLREESKRDAQTVQALCETLQVECVVGGEDVGAYAKKNKLSMEEAARELRYRFLFQLARKKNAQAVAVGHTADDQAETLLLHVLRGSALRGLKGMSHRGFLEIFDKELPLVRPLLQVSRAETVAYCQARGLPFLHDASNDSPQYLRNRIRLELLPLLESYNPQVKAALLRLSQAVRDDLQILDSLEDSLWRNCAKRGDGFVVLELSPLAESADGLKRRLILRAMRTLRPTVDATRATLNRALASMKKEAQGQKIDLQGGLYLLREEDRLYIAQKDADLPFPLFPQIEEEIEVGVPAQVALKNGWTFKTEYAEDVRLEEVFSNAKRYDVWLDAEAPPAPLRLGKPRAGEKIRPLGMNGRSQKISDVFVNEKIPRRAREGWVVLRRGEEVLWVAGLRVSQSCRVTEKTQRVVHASLTKS